MVAAPVQMFFFRPITSTKIPAIRDPGISPPKTSPAERGRANYHLYFAFPQGRKLNQEICVQLLHLENALTRMVKAARHHGEEIKSYLLTPTIQNYAIHFVSCPHFLKFCFSCQLNLPPSISMNDRTSFVNFTPEKCLACTVPVIKGLRHIILSNT